MRVLVGKMETLSDKLKLAERKQREAEGLAQSAGDDTRKFEKEGTKISRRRRRSVRMRRPSTAAISKCGRHSQTKNTNNSG